LFGTLTPDAVAADNFGMAVPSEQDVYLSRCLRVSAAATAAGLEMRKAEKAHALEVSSSSSHGQMVVFPIVTDDRTWKETTVEEAFYVVLLDARGWSNAKLDDVTVGALDPAEKYGVPLMKRDLMDERLRIAQLSDMVGADKLAELLALAEL
jgi:hypothetical protein